MIVYLKKKTPLSAPYCVRITKTSFLLRVNELATIYLALEQDKWFAKYVNLISI